nr:hypothetical protein [Mongoliibacter sp.]
MNRKYHMKKRAVFIRVELRTWRTIVFHSFDNSRNTCSFSFCQIKFLEEITQSSVPVSPWKN